MNGKRLVLILLLVAVGIAIAGGVIWFLRNRDAADLPGLNPSRQTGPVIDPDDPALQAAPDGPILPSWKEGDPEPSQDAPPPNLEQPPFTNPANQPVE